MMEAAIDLRQELANLQGFRLNFAGEPDVVIPEPFPEWSGEKVLTMAMMVGHPFTDRASVQAAGWEVEVLVRRAADVYLEMIFHDGVYHADPHPGNFLLPDGQHLAILDFGDVGRLTTQRRGQLESLVIAVGTHDVDALIDIVVELTTPPPDVDIPVAECHRDVAQPLPVRRCRTARHERDLRQRHAAPPRAPAGGPR